MDKKQNSDLFLSTFNRLEKHLKNELFRGQWKSFKQMLKEGSRFNPVLRNFKEELFEFADLRNAIVHNHNHEFKAIAEPHDNIVTQFAEITEAIVNPLKVDIFRKKVYTCKISDNINVPISLIYQHKISQVPLLDTNGSVLDIFNANTIAYWFAAHDFKPDANERIDAVFSFKEFKQNFRVIPEKTSVYAAAELYKNSHKEEPKSRYYDALLITKNGKLSEPLTGIIVLSDIAKYI